MIDGTTKLLKVPRICFFQSLSLSLSGKALLESIKFSTFHFAFKILKAFQKTSISVSWHFYSYNIYFKKSGERENVWHVQETVFFACSSFLLALLKKTQILTFLFTVSSQLQNDVSPGFNLVKVKKICFLLFHIP